MTREKAGTRRRYGKNVEAQVVAECEAPGASVAKLAMAHGINANIVHGWRKLARQRSQAVVSKPAEFIAVAVAPAQVKTPDASDRGIEIELRRGAIVMKLNWPVSAAADLVARTRELLW